MNFPVGNGCELDLGPESTVEILGEKAGDVDKSSHIVVQKPHLFEICNPRKQCCVHLVT